MHSPRSFGAGAAALRGATMLALALLMGACASQKAPPAAPAPPAIETTPDASRISGALLVEPRPLHQAQQRLDQARTLLDRRRDDQARVALNLAQAEAQLARGLAGENDEARRAAKELERQIRTLRKELSRRAGKR